MEDGELDVEESDVAVEPNPQVIGLSWSENFAVLSSLLAPSLTVTAVTTGHCYCVRSLPDHLFLCHLSRRNMTESFHSASLKRPSLQKQ